MKFQTVSYSALLNLGNYSNEKIGFTVEVDEGELPEKIVETLRQKVREIGGPNAEELYSQMYDNRHKLAELNSKIQKATEQWNATAEFLRAQGIKPDSPNMPQLINLLPEVKEERFDVVEGEIEESGL